MKYLFGSFLVFIALSYSCKEYKHARKVSAKSFVPVEQSFAKLNNVRGPVIEYSEAQFLDPYSTKISDGNNSTYILDTDGNLLEKKHIAGRKPFVLLNRYFYDGPIEIETIHNYNGLQIGWFKTIKKVRNNVITKKIYDEQGNIRANSESKYDSNGNLTYYEYFSDGRIFEKSTFKYKGNECIEEYGYDLPGKTVPSVKVVYKYDKYGNKTN